MTDRQRWQAVLDNDRRYDGTFFYGVASTGIFCPSLLPLPTAAAGPGAVLPHGGRCTGGGVPPLQALPART